MKRVKTGKKQQGFFDFGIGLGLLLLFGGTATVVAPHAPESTSVAKVEQSQPIRTTISISDSEDD